MAMNVKIACFFFGGGGDFTPCILIERYLDFSGTSDIHFSSNDDLEYDGLCNIIRNFIEWHSVILNGE